MMLNFIPFVTFVVVFAATIARGLVLHRRTGDNVWAFAGASGLQRATSVVFALSIGLLALASVRTTGRSASVFTAVAALVAIGGGIIIVIAQHQMGRAWRIGIRSGDAPLFVNNGLFRFSRNPVFFGMILLGLGMAIAASDWWSWLAWLVFIAACAIQVRLEEQHLARMFGQSYQDYQAQVPRWIGVR